MTLKSSFLYAWRIIFPKNKHGIGYKSFVGAMVCIGISLIPLVCVLVISNGMIEGITGRIIGLSTQDISVILNKRSSDADNYASFDALSSRLCNTEGVVDSYPEIDSNVLVIGNNYRTGATVRAVKNDIFQKNESFVSLLNVISGKAEFTSPKSAVIGQNISETLGIKVGDSIRIVSVNASDSGKVIPKISSFVVEGIVTSGYQELDALWIFIPLESGFSMLSSSCQYMINLVTTDRYGSSLIKTKMAVQDEIFGLNGNPVINGAYVYTWNEINESQFENFSSTKSLLFLIMLLIVLVASVNISSALIMIVMERKKEISILKSLGASSEGVTTSFMIVGFACGLGGVIIGIPLGLLAAVNINEIIRIMERFINFFIKLGYLLVGSGDDFHQVKLLNPSYYLQSIPVDIPFTELFLIGAMTLVLSLLVSSIPAIKAGNGKPIETLRKM